MLGKAGVRKVGPLRLCACAAPWMAASSLASLSVFKNAQKLFLNFYFNSIMCCLMFSLVINHIVNGEVRRG